MHLINYIRNWRSKVDNPETEVVHEEDVIENEMVNLIHDFISPSNDPTMDDINVEDDVQTGPTMFA